MAMAGIADPLTEPPPPSRLDVEEELNSFASSSLPPSHSPPPHIHWSPWIRPLFSPHGKLPTHLFLLAASHPACHLLHHLPNKKLIGSVVLLPKVSLPNDFLQPTLDDKACYLYTMDDRVSVVIASIQYSIPAERIHSWVKLVFGVIQPQNVLTLGHLNSEYFRGRLSADDRVLFRLETDQQRLAKSDTDVTIPYLPSGSLIDGIGAAILTHCQFRGLFGRLLLTWPDCDATVVSLLASTLTFLLKSFPAAKALDFSAAKQAPFRRKSVADSELYV